ncbi:MAG: hypothetical protein ACMUIM_07270 [bacterium]
MMGANFYQNKIRNKSAFILVLIIGTIFVISNNAFTDSPSNVGKDKSTLTPTNIYGSDDKGKYLTDPLTWVRNGFNVLIYDLNFTIRAQLFDQNGSKMNDVISYSVPELGLRGNMYIFNPIHKCQKADIQRPLPFVRSDYEVIINAGSVRQAILVHFGATGCDKPGCHPVSPPEHVIEKQSTDNIKSRCNNCHNLALKIHPKHYKKVPNDVKGCNICHPHSGCLIGRDFKVAYMPHIMSNMTCIDCHGTLNDSIKGSFKIRSERGLPRCDDCHDDKEYSYPKGSLFKESYGHGGVACINCHAATHLASFMSIGANACARACHTTQSNDSKMGPDCGKCHNTSVAPHLVKR